MLFEVFHRVFGIDGFVDIFLEEYIQDIVSDSCPSSLQKKRGVTKNISSKKLLDFSFHIFKHIHIESVS
jgi:hypothetical protein